MREKSKTPNRQALKKLETENNYVSKKCASELRELLTGNTQTLSVLLTKLYTLEASHLQSLKTGSANRRVREAFQALRDCVTYGWHYGLAELSVPETKLPAIGSRRLKALFKPAMQAGKQIAKSQLVKITALRHAPGQEDPESRSGRQA